MHLGCTGVSTMLDLLLGGDGRIEPSSARPGEAPVTPGIGIYTTPLRGKNPTTGEPMAILVLKVRMTSSSDGKLLLLLRSLASMLWVNTLVTRGEWAIKQAFADMASKLPLIDRPHDQHMRWLVRDVDWEIDSATTDALLSTWLSPRDHRSLRDLFPTKAAVIAVPPLRDSQAAFAAAIGSLGVLAREETPALADLQGESCTGKSFLALVETSIEAINALLHSARRSKPVEMLHGRSAEDIPPPGAVSVNLDDCLALTSLEGLPLPESIRHASFQGCTALRSVNGLPDKLRWVAFNSCTSLVSVAGLPESLRFADFRDCTSLTDLRALPVELPCAYFDGCTSLTTLKGLQTRSRLFATFTGCTRLRRFAASRKKKTVHFFGNLPNPADDVRSLARSGVGDRLLERVGPDVALLVGCLATAGFNSSPPFGDHVETSVQTLARYHAVLSSFLATRTRRHAGARK